MTREEIEQECMRVEEALDRAYKEKRAIEDAITDLQLYRMHLIKGLDPELYDQVQTRAAARQ